MRPAWSSNFCPGLLFLHFPVGVLQPLLSRNFTETLACLSPYGLFSNPRVKVEGLGHGSARTEI